MSPQQLVENNLGFVVKVAGRYAGMGLPLDDLIGEGNLGLIQAAQHYDPERGTRFITYAVWWIRKAILSALSRQPSIRLPHTLRRKIRAVFDAELDIARETGAHVPRHAIARRLRTSIERVDRALLAHRPEISFDQTLGLDGSAPMHEILPDRVTPSPEAAAIRKDAGATVRRVMAGLSERERHVLTQRFGLNDDPPLTLRQIGRDHGVSCEAIRLIERRAKKKLRGILVKGPRRSAAAAAAHPSGARGARRCVLPFSQAQFSSSSQPSETGLRRPSPSLSAW